MQSMHYQANTRSINEGPQAVISHEGLMSEADVVSTPRSAVENLQAIQRP